VQWGLLNVIQHKVRFDKITVPDDDGTIISSINLLSVWKLTDSRHI
jgi:hypothetical protein